MEPLGTGFSLGSKLGNVKEDIFEIFRRSQLHPREKIWDCVQERLD